MKSLLNGASQTLFAIAGLSFLVGGRAIYAFARTEWLLAEMETVGVGLVCAALGVLANSVAERSTGKM